MRRYLLILGIAFSLGFVVLVPLLFRAIERNPAAAQCDLSVAFIGFTNNPVSTPPPTRFAVPGSGIGLHALFAVTNTSTNNWIRFHTAAAEWFEGGAWKEFAPVLEGWPSNQWRGIEGWLWPPGFGCLYAVAWPGISTNSSWRLRVSVATDPTPLKQVVNTKTGLEIFRPHHAMVFTGPEVSLGKSYPLLIRQSLQESGGPERRK